MQAGLAVAEDIRRRIHAATGCTASAGVGRNLLLARLATKRAKPDGQSCIGDVCVCAHVRDCGGE